MDSLEERSERQSMQATSSLTLAQDVGTDWRSAYSMSSPDMRLALVATPAAETSKATAVPTEIPTSISPPKVVPPEIVSNDPIDNSRVVDPCTKAVINPHLAPAVEAKPMERVQDRDPDLYKQIKSKVNDPRYIGQNGDITVSTHDKRGRINGCTFVQNTPYWLDINAAKSYLDLNRALAPKRKEIEVDHLNGAGRTLGQEEGIAWRNTGLHAKPGKSNHGFGRAIDIQDIDGAPVQPSDDKEVREALHANGFRQGDSHGPLKNDLHHWSYTGPGRATEGHAIAPKQVHGHGHRHEHGHGQQDHGHHKHR